MAMQPASDGSIVIAGREVFTASADGGQTWQPISADLPSLDIHGFTRDPADPASDVGVPGDGWPLGEHRQRGALAPRP
jgi:hypothetical protein